MISAKRVAIGLFSSAFALTLGACPRSADNNNPSEQVTPTANANNPGARPPIKRPRRRRGIVGETAPGWKVSRWFNLPAGKKTLDITDYRGKVVYLFFFQSW